MAGFFVDVLGFDPAVARITQFVIAFLVVVAAIFLGLWGFVRLTRRMRGDDEFGPSRLRVADVVPVDDKRRLVLIRRDDVEHLVLVGGPTDIVVESGIRRTPVARSQPGRPPETTADARPAEPRAAAAARPASRPEPLLEEPPIEPAPRLEPALDPTEPYPPRREPPPIDLGRPPERA